MSEDPTEQVVAWLNRSGFPLEMRVAAAWEQAGFAVAQSVYYIDPETEDAREADILASREEVTADAWLRVTVVVECKARADAGWVVFPRRGVPLNPAGRIRMLTAPVSTSPYLSRVGRRPEVSTLGAFAPRTIAYAMAQVKRIKDVGQEKSKDREDGKDHAYAAIMGVSKATSSLLEQLSQDRSDDEFEVLWPVIVTESPLFAAQLGTDGAVAVQAITECTLSWRHPTARGVLAIDVVHASVLNEYVKKVAEAAEFLTQHTAAELSQTAEKRRARRAASQTPDPPPTV